MIYSMCVCHWLACTMKIVDEGFLVSYVYENWTSYDDVRRNTWSEYISAIYWAMTTITTVGYGDITPSSDAERVYTTISMVVGGAFYGYVVGSITSLVQYSDLNTSAYYDRMDLIHAWLTHHEMPVRMKRIIRGHFKSYLTERSAVNEADIWHDLTPQLQMDVAEFIIHDDVKNNPLFDGMSVGSVVQLQAILQPVTATLGTKVVTIGQVGSAMYIVVSGFLLMEAAFERQEKLGPGQSFGEEVLLGFLESYEYTVTVKEKVKLQMVQEAEFLKLFRTMPNELERMRHNALEHNPQWENKGVMLRRRSLREL